MTTDVSVIIPSFNRAHCLARALDSVLAQQTPAREIIVIDDGSTDHTRTLINTHYPQIHYVYQSNQGVSAARNQGIALAQGAWLAFLDSDDEWLPEKLSQQTAAIAAQPQYRICHCDEIWIRRGLRVNAMNKHRKAGGDLFAACLPLCVISPSAVMIERQVFNDYGVFDTQLPACEDYDLWLRLCAQLPVLYLDQLLLKKYGGHEDQLSKRYWGMDRFRVQALENLFASGQLQSHQQTLLLTTLCKKLQILLQGAQKHHNTELAQSCETKLRHYQQHQLIHAESTPC